MGDVLLMNMQIWEKVGVGYCLPKKTHQRQINLPAKHCSYICQQGVRNSRDVDIGHVDGWDYAIVQACKQLL